MSKETPLRYAGGKARAINIISQHIPNYVKDKRIISPFAGGCSLEIYWAKIYALDEVIAYDIFKPLVNFWNVLLTQPKDLADALQIHKPTKEYFTEARERLKSVWDIKSEEILIADKVEQASLYYYNHQCSYGPMFLGWPSSVYLKENVYKKIVDRIRNFRCPKLKVKFGNFVDTIPNHTNDFLYLDPPYFEEGKMFKALYPNCNFPIHHKGFLHDKLRDLLYDHKGEFLLSYNECPTIKKWYKNYDLYYPKWHYSYQQGEKRIGKNRIEQGKKDSKKKSHEILIVNTNTIKKSSFGENNWMTWGKK